MTTLINNFTAILSLCIGIAALALSLYNAWWQQRVRGPEFAVSEAFLVWKTPREGVENRIESRVMTLIQNIGDRMGYLRLETVKLAVTTKNHSVEGIYYRYAKTAELLLAGEIVKERPVEFVLKVGKSDLNLQKKVFHFILPEEAKDDWLEAKLILEGEHSSHKGTMHPYRKEIIITLK